MPVPEAFSEFSKDIAGSNRLPCIQLTPILLEKTAVRELWDGVQASKFTYPGIFHTGMPPLCREFPWQRVKRRARFPQGTHDPLFLSYLAPKSTSGLPSDSCPPIRCGSTETNCTGHFTNESKSSSARSCQTTMAQLLLHNAQRIESLNSACLN
jgi:hypothetical protein